MLENRPAPGTPEVSRTLQAFARAARARQLYAPNNRAYQRMIEDLSKGLASLLDHHSVLTLRIRPDRLLFEDQTVLEEETAHDSIPFALYRDGLRRLDFSRGVTDDELEALLSATAAGFAFSGLGDDIVSHLWKHDLEHIRYLVVDTSIVEATAAGPSSSPPAESAFYDNMEAQIDGLLQAIYGDSVDDDVGPRAVHLDAADLGAKRIAEALDDVHDMAPGFHPSRRLPQPPAYGPDLLAEAYSEDQDRVSARAANANLRALHQLDDDDADAACEGLLRMFDAAVMADDLLLAARIVAGVRACPGYPPRAQQWIEEAVSEARVRHAIQPVTEVSASKQSFVHLFQFLQACGPTVVSLIVPMLGQFLDPVRRRALSDLAADLGAIETAKIKEMMADSSPAVVQEGLHLLARSAHAQGPALWTAVEKHPNPLARVALLEARKNKHDSTSLNIATRLLNDGELRVRVAAVECIASLRHPDAESVIADAVERPSFESEPKELKRALLQAYAKTNGGRSTHILSRMVKRAEGPLVRRETEDLAVYAILALGQIQDRRADELLTKTANSKSRRLKETAQQVLAHRKNDA